MGGEGGGGVPLWHKALVFPPWVRLALCLLLHLA
eukprot:SAG31_NODE_44444_length_262_cov_8.073620_1_plen_33_part_10